MPQVDDTGWDKGQGRRWYWYWKGSSGRAGQVVDDGETDGWVWAWIAGPGHSVSCIGAVNKRDPERKKDKKVKKKSGWMPSLAQSSSAVIR